MTVYNNYGHNQGDPWFTRDIQSLIEGLGGYGIIQVSDGEITDGTNDMEIDVASGTVWYNGSTYSISATTKTLSDGNSTDDRYDLIEYDTSTTSVNVVQGTAQTNPVVPSAGSDAVILGYVYVPAGATDISSNEIVNTRAPASKSSNLYFEDANSNWSSDDIDDVLTSEIFNKFVNLDGEFSLQGDITDDNGVTLYDYSAGHVPYSTVDDDAKRRSVDVPLTEIADTESAVGLLLNIPSGKTLKIWEVGVQDDTNSAPTGLTIDVYDATNSTSIVSQNTKYNTGNPIASKSGAIDVEIRVSNSTGGTVNASGHIIYTLV